jgi:uncharacterized protein
MRRIGGWLVLGLLVAACGSSGDEPKPEATPTSTPTATATAEIEDAAVAKMPEVEAGQSELPAPASTKVHDANVLHEAFSSSEAMWEREFAAAGSQYRHAKLVFFHNTVETPCGQQSREVGPFYCPASLGVYLNTAFFDALARTFGLRSGFAAGYIVAHEIGHHVQQLLGTHGRVAAANQSDPNGANGRSIQVELQADCFAGVWLHSVSRQGELSESDVRDILRAAEVVGDDFQRNQAGAELAPETWTHGSSEQRQRWVVTGLQSGRPDSCDTFSAG